MISAFLYLTSDYMILLEILFMYKIRLTITNVSDMKAGPGHMIVIVCMSVDYFALFIIMGL